MPERYMLYSLDVGQGMCTFFEYYNDGGAVKGVALFDIGSSKSKKKAGTPTIQFLSQQIIARSPPDGFIDIVFVSHKDGDHVNLIDALLKAVPNAGIGIVRYGGRYSWYKTAKQGNVLDKLGARTANAERWVTGFPVGRSDYNPKTGEFGLPLLMGNSYSFYLLAANAPHKDEKIGTTESDISHQPDGDQANSKSLVVLLFMGNTCAVIGGDATFPTLQYINGFFDKYFVNNVMTLLPHHGSRKTTFGLGETDGAISSENRAVVSTYAERLKGLTVVASADTKHSHPSLETIETFLAFTDKTKSWWSDPGLEGGMHYATAYIDIDFASKESIPKTYTTYQTSQNLYSTLYYHKLSAATFSYSPFVTPATAPKSSVAFPNGMNWIYSSTAGSAATALAGVSSNRLDVARLALLRSDPAEGAPRFAPLEPPPPAAIVVTRRPTAGDARGALPPRGASALRRLVSVP